MLYIWEPGAVSDEIFRILIERARAGVQVRVMVDGLGGHKAHSENIRTLQEAGGHWAWFHPARFGCNIGAGLISSTGRAPAESADGCSASHRWFGSCVARRAYLFFFGQRL